MRTVVLLPAILALAACASPFRLENANEGIAITFPGRPLGGTFQEETPFGTILWYNHVFTPAGRMDLNYRVDVGNLPRGKKGGDTSPAVLATFQRFLEYRLGPVRRAELPAGRGPGFSYTVAGPSGTWIAGMVIVRRARIHHAQATVKDLGEPALRTFLDGFEVAR